MLPRISLPNWLDLFWPADSGLTVRQCLVITLGVFVGMALTAAICGVAQDQYHLHWWLMAPLGASAVQIFAVPGSPLAQPWSVVGGHALSALSGLVAFYVFGHTTLGAAAAVAVAAGLMLSLRALHPSGGGTALFIVLSQTDDPAFILFPVITSAVLLVATAILFHKLTGHVYPQRQRIRRGAESLALHRFDPEDLESALRAHDQILDISREDIKQLIAHTEMQAYRRMAKGLTCEQIMMRPVKSVEASSRAVVASHVMARNNLKILPVTGAQQQLVGAIKYLPADPAGNASAYIGQDFVTAAAGDPVADILPRLSEHKGHVLVVDAQRQLKGIISRSDIMRALFHNG